MMKTLYTLFALLFTSTLSAQSPSGIESAEYDPSGERWFVSCGSSTLLSTSDMGDSWDFFGSANASYGMEVMNGALFVIQSNQVYAYDLNTAELLGMVSIAGAGFLNGMGSDGNGTLIISDFSTGRILKIDASDPANMSTSTLVGNTGSTPNGVVIDVANGRAVVVNWGGNSDILAIDIESGAVTTLVNGSGLGNCDGIDMDSEGNYYISSWSPTRITKYNSDFTESEIVVSSGLSSPADISFDEANNILGVANSGSDQVTFHYFSGASTQSTDIQEGLEVEFNGNEFIFNLSLGDRFTFTAYTLDGKLLEASFMSLPSGKSSVLLDRLPEGFSKAALVHISRDSATGNSAVKTFKLGLHQL